MLALRDLSALLRTGLSVRRALTSWHEVADDVVSPELRNLTKRLRLGQASAPAVARLSGPLREDAAALAAIVAITTRTGGDAAAMVDGVARSARARDEQLLEAESHGAGARLSGRLVAGLPLAFIPLAPMTRAPLTDAPGLMLFVIGVGLAVGGLAWISALFPRPPSDDDAGAVIAELLACSLAAGGTATTALREICMWAPPGLEHAGPRIKRLLDLGLKWSDALAGAGSDELAKLAAAVRNAEDLGLPLVAALRSWARSRRMETTAEFEAAVRRAPVRMAVPLAVCVLPAFVILGIAPFLRGLSLTA